VLAGSKAFALIVLAVVPVTFVPVAILLLGKLISPLPSSEVLLTVLMLVPLTNAACLPLNVLQSVVLNAPRLVADAVGKLN
jgi:polyferredoxin